MIRVSVIIVNYNGKGLITDCLKSLERQSFKDFEVIIVDNNSLDGSQYEIQRFLKKRSIAPFIKLISLDRNLGFAGGNIEGLKYTGNSEYIALLNNDTEPDGRWLEELTKAIENRPLVGICASKLIVYGTNLIDSAGDGFSTSLKGFKRGEGETISSYNKGEYVFGACAAAVLYRRNMIEEIGFLDEDFFLIHEDTDLNLRAQLYGWKAIFVPTAIVYHKVRSSIGKMSPKAVYYSLRNSELVRIKNIPLTLFLRCLPVFLLGMVSEFLYLAIKYKHPVLYFKAKLDAVKMFPIMLKKRKANIKAKRATDSDLRDIIALTK